FIGLVTPYVWWFISSYEKLRKYILENTTISTLIQLEYNAFEGAAMPIGTFVLRNYPTDIEGTYIKLSDFRGIENQPIKALEAINNPDVYYRYNINQKKLHSIPGSPIAYWVNKNVIDNFNKGISIDSISDYTGSQNKTANNEKYLRYIWEVENNKVGENKKWVLYSKGGNYRK